MKKLKITKKYIPIIALLLTLCALCSCQKNPSSNITKPPVDSQTDMPTDINFPEGENKKEKIDINENYAESELFDFEGTIDEIYDDGSILIYSPMFGVNFNYKAIIEFDQNTSVPDFKLAENQLVKFDVYSAVKKSEPLTLVASKLTLISETSKQREEEEARRANVRQNAAEAVIGLAVN